MSRFFEELNSKELSVIDDISKSLVLEPYLGFKIPKMNLCPITEIILCDEQIIHDIIKRSINNLSPNEIWHELSKFLDIKMLLVYISDLDYVKQQVLSYLKVIQVDSSILVAESFRYSCLQRQVRLIANKDLQKNIRIYDVSSFYAKLNPREEILLEKRDIDFSIINISGCKEPLLLLGPVALINHDCRANCLYIKDKDGKVCIITKRKIKKNEEITCSYSKHYFGMNNAECECESCEILIRGAFKEPKKQTQIEDLCENVNFVANTIKFQKLVKSTISENLYFDKQFQRRINTTCSNSLMYNSEMYNKFIKFLKFSSMIKDFTAPLSFSENEIYEIVENTYKNYHTSSYKAVEKFITLYQETIKMDIKDYTEFTKILAPEQKKIEDYFYELIQICILLCPEDAALCIYRGQKLSLKTKTMILQKMFRGRTPTSKDKTKLDNTFSKYNVYLQGLSQNLIDKVLKKVMLNDINRRTVSVDIPKLFMQHDNHDKTSELVTTESSRTSSEFNLSLPFTREEIIEIIGV